MTDPKSREAQTCSVCGGPGPHLTSNVCIWFLSVSLKKAQEEIARLAAHVEKQRDHVDVIQDRLAERIASLEKRQSALEDACDNYPAPPSPEPSEERCAYSYSEGEDPWPCGRPLKRHGQEVLHPFTPAKENPATETNEIHNLRLANDENLRLALEAQAQAAADRAALERVRRLMRKDNRAAFFLGKREMMFVDELERALATETTRAKEENDGVDSGGSTGSVRSGTEATAFPRDARGSDVSGGLPVSPPVSIPQRVRLSGANENKPLELRHLWIHQRGPLCDALPFPCPDLGEFVHV